MLIAEATRFGVDVSPQQVEQLRTYLDLLRRWGARIRLTGKTDIATLIHRHLADAFVLSRHVNPTAAQAADIGAGAGLPSVALAILRPQLTLTLVEPNQRRCVFLRMAAAETQTVGVRVIATRWENCALGPQDWMWSRATWAPTQWLTLAAAAVASGGKVVAFLSDKAELPQPPAALTLVTNEQYSLVDGTQRRLLIYHRP